MTTRALTLTGEVEEDRDPRDFSFLATRVFIKMGDTAVFEWKTNLQYFDYDSDGANEAISDALMAFRERLEERP